MRGTPPPEPPVSIPEIRTPSIGKLTELDPEKLPELLAVTPRIVVLPGNALLASALPRFATINRMSPVFVALTLTQ
jgi:hypothetical protein